MKLLREILTEAKKELDPKKVAKLIVSDPNNPFSLTKTGKLHNKRFINATVQRVGRKMLGGKAPGGTDKAAHNEFDRYYENRKAWGEVKAEVKRLLQK